MKGTWDLKQFCIFAKKVPKLEEVEWWSAGFFINGHTDRHIIKNDVRQLSDIGDEFLAHFVVPYGVEIGDGRKLLPHRARLIVDLFVQ